MARGQVAKLGRASDAGILNSQPCRDMPTFLPCPHFNMIMNIDIDRRRQIA
jgi:hypothetical protein